MTTHQITKREREKLNDSIVNSIIRTLFKDGTLKLEDLDNDNELKRKLLAINKKADWKIVVDHSDNLISTAEGFADKADFHKAKLFYAVFFEHELNKIIDDLCNRRAIRKKAINEIIKSVNIIGKLTWLPLLLDIPTVSEKHKNIILKVADDRNAYIHYKHNPLPDEIGVNDKEKYKEEFKQIEQTVTYFKKYVSRITYRQQKTHLDRKIKSKNNFYR